MLYIWSYLKRYPKWLVLDFVAAIFFVIVNLGLPTVLARMIDEGINPKQTDRLFFWAWVMFGVIILGVLGRIVLAYAAGKLTTTMVQDMRNDLYAKLQEYSHHEYEQIGVSSLVTRLTSDAFVLMQFAEQALKMGVITPMMMLSSILMIFLTSPSLAWIVAVSVPFLAVVVIYVAVKTKPLSEKQQKTLDKINQYVRENLTGLRVIRAFAREEFQEKRFADENEVYAQNSNKLFKLTGLTEPLFVQIIIAMIFEAAGAYLAGGEVTETIKSGIIDTTQFINQPEVLVFGMMAALFASGAWLLIASKRGWPVSTTHSIIGAVVGFSCVTAGFHSVDWSNIKNIVGSWFITPVIAGLLAYAIFISTQKLIFDTESPLKNAQKYGPYYMGLTIFILCIVTLTKGLKHVGLNLTGTENILLSLVISLFGIVYCYFYFLSLLLL